MNIKSLWRTKSHAESQLINQIKEGGSGGGRRGSGAPSSPARPRAGRATAGQGAALSGKRGQPQRGLSGRTRQRTRRHGTRLPERVPSGAVAVTAPAAVVDGLGELCTLSQRHSGTVTAVLCVTSSGVENDAGF